ncbi:hypothetical protein JCM8547_001644 [Rhodosporidiobolus lusitaniae]
MAFIFKGYIRLLQRYTLPTQMATAATTSGAGDLLYQTYFERKSFNEVEWYKTQRLAFYGAFCWAPLSNRWHTVLARINLNGKIKTTLARTATDLAIFSPFATCLFYSVQGAFEGRSIYTPAPTLENPKPQEGVYNRLEERLWPIVQKQWLVFGPANMINLSVVPQIFRPPFMNVFSLGWNCFLAASNAQNSLPAPAPASAPAHHTLQSPQKITDRDLTLAAVEAMD